MGMMALTQTLRYYCYGSLSSSSCTRRMFIFFPDIMNPIYLLPNSKSKSKSSSFSFSFLNPRTKFSSSSLKSIPTLSDPQLLLLTHDSPFSGLEDVMMGYLFGKMKATQVAHSVWKHVIQKGDALVDATCGNGHDTLAMLKMLVAHNSLTARVYAMDIQKTALENTMSLLDLDGSLNPDERKLVELFNSCHSRMEEVIPKGSTVRLVAFNLGYLPGGDKTLITRSETTTLALEAAQRILARGGLISLVVYVGHPGGIEELERVEAFASGLTVDNWICCKLQMLNKPLAPILVFMFKKKFPLRN